MTDEIRERIAQTIYGDGNGATWACSLSLADLIIWDLGLKQERSFAWDGRRSYQTGNRYVTEWTSQ